MKTLQVAFVHDHTASMGGLRMQVRRNNCATIAALQSYCTQHGIKLEVGVVSILDLHDEPHGKDLVGLQLTADSEVVKRHIMQVPDARPNSSGEECYERALHLLRSWNWKTDAIKAVVFTGDSIPHSTRHDKNPDKFDWMVEARALVKECDMRIYSIQALTWSGADRKFWVSLAEIGKTVPLELDQFDHINTLLLAIVARETGNFAAWEQEYRATNPLSYSEQRAMDRLAGRRESRFVSRNSARKIATSGRFQVYTIEEKISAAEFFRQIGVITDISEYGQHKGELFYAHESRASEELRPQHEVIIEDDRSGEMIMGVDARMMVGIPYGTKGSSIRKNQLKGDGFTIWIQSKSVGNSRHLEKGQRVMIDLNPSAGFGR